MAEKVKVSREVADAIEYMRERLTDANIIDARYDEKFQFALEGQPLNDVPPLELTKIILNGFEIEQTPEEILLKEYNDDKQRGETSKPLSYEDGYWKGHADGIYDSLEIQNIKIKGINE